MKNTHVDLRRFGWRVAAVVSCLPVASGVQSTTLVSLDSSGVQGNASSLYCSISADGRYVAFDSSASNLVPADLNGTADVFVRDTQTGTTELVSVSSSQVQGNGASGGPAISADGRFIVFASNASTLVPSDVNGTYDVFVHDRLSGTTEIVSLSSSGVHGDAVSGGQPSISSNGRFVTFVSSATNLVPLDTNGKQDIFVRDRQTGTTERVSVSSTGVEGNDNSLITSISADGRFVAFSSNASNLIPVDLNGVADIFLRDRGTGVTELISQSSLGVQGDNGSSSPSISADGRYVAFESGASNLIPNDANFSFGDVFVRDRQTGTTELESLSSSGVQGDFTSFSPSISADGRYVAFGSQASNLIPGDINGSTDVFLRDRQSGTCELVSQSSSGTMGDNGSHVPSLSSDGRSVAFYSDATNLVSPDVNGAADVFVRDRGAPSTPTIYCVAKTNSLGCIPAIGFAGVASGSAGSGFFITAASVLNNRSGLLFYGKSGAMLLPLQGGFLCARQPLKRTALQNSGGNPPPSDCSGMFSIDFNAYIASGVDPALNVGQQVWAQYWSRDRGFLPPDNTNTTDAITFVIGP